MCGLSNIYRAQYLKSKGFSPNQVNAIGDALDQKKSCLLEKDRPPLTCATATATPCCYKVFDISNLLNHLNENSFNRGNCPSPLCNETLSAESDGSICINKYPIPKLPNEEKPKHVLMTVTESCLDDPGVVLDT